MMPPNIGITKLVAAAVLSSQCKFFSEFYENESSSGSQIFYSSKARSTVTTVKFDFHMHVETFFGPFDVR